jgi:hypothetical protein
LVVNNISFLQITFRKKRKKKEKKRKTKEKKKKRKKKNKKGHKRKLDKAPCNNNDLIYTV